MREFLLAFMYYLREVLPYLAIGFLLSGLVHEFVPSRWIEKWLGGRGIKPILYSAIIGMAAPMCCFGALPIAVSLREKGARLGPVLAFLVAAPAVSVVSVIAAYNILGARFMGYMIGAVVAMGLVTGLAGNAVMRNAAGCIPRASTSAGLVCDTRVESDDRVRTVPNGRRKRSSSSPGGRRCTTSFGERIGDPPKLAHRVRDSLKYGYVDMAKEIGPELLLGLAIAALLVAVVPVREVVSTHLSGGFGYLFSLGFGLAKYTSSITSIHLVDALMSANMSAGAGMVLLLAGPITSWGTILVLRKEFGGRVLATYLGVVCLLSLALGYCFSMV